MSDIKAWPAVVCSIVFLVLGVFGHAYFTEPQNVPTASEIAAKINVPAPAVYDDSVLVAKVDSLTNEVLKDDLKEAFAEQLVSDELTSKDFRKELRSLLNDELSASNNTATVEDYKDVHKVVVKDAEWTVTGDNANVDLELKVYFYLDGDDEETNYALVDVTLSVSDLDEDEEYVDAEVDSYDNSDFDLKRFRFD